MKKKCLMIILLFAVIISARATTISLNPDNIPVYMYSTENSAVEVAYNYLNRDMNKITGKNFIMNKIGSYGNIPTDNWSIVILNNSNGFPDIPENIKNKVTGYESHRIFVDTAKKNIILQGYDARGTIFAIYTFSEHILGVPPLWFWSSWQPEMKAQIEIPNDLDIFYDIPSVKYRSFFPNDTDLFSPFIKINDETKNVWIETMMRLKLNTTEQNTVINVRTKQLTETGNLIKKHGMVLTSHHQTILNVEFSKWDEYWKYVRGYNTPPELRLTNEQELIEFWRYAVEAIHDSGIENVWVIGLRGNGDTPFWASFPDSPSSSADRGTVINRFFPKQLQIIKDVTGNQNPETRIILYNELATLYSGGHLAPPIGDNIILTFSAVRQDPYPNQDFINFNPQTNTRTGYYMNLQFYTTGCHLAQGEGPWKMESNYRYVCDKENTKLDYSVLNVGNLREFFLTVDANARMMWNPNNYNTDDFILDFCKTYFGEANAAEVAELYRNFFYAYWEQQNSSFPGMERQFIFQDLRIKSAIARFCTVFSQPTLSMPLTDTAGRSYQIVPSHSNATNQVDAVINGTVTSIDRWENVTTACDELYNRLPVASKIFFNDNLRSQAHFMHQISIAFFNTAYAYKNKSRANIAANSFNKAYLAMGSAKEYLYEGQHDIFSDWFAGDARQGGKFNVPQIENQMIHMRDSILSIPIVKDTLFAVADAYTSCFASDRVNHGSEVLLKVSRNNSSPANKFNSYIKFDLSSLNIDLNDITGLEFGIYKRGDGLATERKVNIALVSANNWDETTIDGNFRSQNSAFSNTSSFSYFTKREGDPQKWYKITSTSTSNSTFYNSVTSSDKNEITLRLYPDDNVPAANDATSINFHSKENATNRPYLLVSYKNKINPNLSTAFSEKSIIAPENFTVFNSMGTLVVDSEQKNYDLVLYDLSGRTKLRKQNLSGISKFDQLKDGYYIVNLIANNIRETKKVFIKR